ncbi:hypothetical protein HDU76_013037 [Blyttiomyces sp. JEL0837]|nr:hypothetical protein HDU76_013037 [Blyttiomyces sp. JEL0837]
MIPFHRWNDNDQYGHVNNSVYYTYFDTIANNYLMSNCGLDPSKSPPTPSQPRGLVISSSCSYHKPATYPSLLRAGLSISKLGNSSVTYRIGIFARVEVVDNGTGKEVFSVADMARMKDWDFDSDNVETWKNWECSASGTFVHVFVGGDGRPVRIPDTMRRGLEKLVLDDHGGDVDGASDATKKSKL